MLQRQIVPSALLDAKRIGQDYRIAGELNQWCHEIVTEADSPQRPLTEISIEEIFDIVTGIATGSAADWVRSREEFIKAGWIDKIKALRALLSHRSPPWKLRLNCRVFHGLDGAVPVEVEAIYDINLVDKTVTFVRFESYTPAEPFPIGDRPQKW